MSKFASKLAHRLDSGERAILTFLLLLAAVLLLTHALSGPFEDAGPDGRAYEELGYRASQAKHIFGCDNFWHAYWSPVWVATIAVIYRAVGKEPQAIRVFLVVIALGTTLLIYTIARNAAGGRAALASAALYVFSTLVFRYTRYYQYEIYLGIAALAVYILLFYRARTPSAGSWSSALSVDTVRPALAGALFGIGALISPRVLVLLPLSAVCLWLQRRTRRAVRALAILTAGGLLVLGPWTARNHACFGQWIWSTTNGGMNFYVGNNAYSTLGYYLPPADARPDHPFYDSASWTREALTYIRAHPLQTLGRMIRKGLHFWNPHYGDQFLITVLFWVGLFRLAKRKRRSLRPDRIWIVTAPFLFMLVTMVYLVQVRYLLPALPFIAVVSGAGLFGWKDEDYEKEERTKRE